MLSFRVAVAQVSAAAAAAILGYQPALGTPLIDLLGLKLYAPWKLFTWWLAFDAQAPHVFARAGALAALGGVLSGAPAIGGAARRAGRPRVPTRYGSARSADFSNVRDAGLLSDEGIVLGLYGSRYLRYDGPEHVLAVAPTGSGIRAGRRRLGAAPPSHPWRCASALVGRTLPKSLRQPGH